MNCESKAISVSMTHVSMKINGARHVSGGVNSTIQFPPEVQLHRQGLKGVCVCVCVCVVLQETYESDTTVSLVKLQSINKYNLLSFDVTSPNKK